MPFRGYPKALVVSETTLTAKIVFRTEPGFFETLSMYPSGDWEMCSFTELEQLCLDLTNSDRTISDIKTLEDENGVTPWHLVFVPKQIGREIALAKVLQARSRRLTNKL